MVVSAPFGMGRDRSKLSGRGSDRSGFGDEKRDGATDVPADAAIRLTSDILPNWVLRSTSLDGLLPVLHLRGISTGDFQEALSALLGADAPNPSPGVVARLTAGWQHRLDDRIAGKAGHLGPARRGALRQLGHTFSEVARVGGAGLCGRGRPR